LRPLTFASATVRAAISAAIRSRSIVARFFEPLRLPPLRSPGADPRGMAESITIFVNFAKERPRGGGTGAAAPPSSDLNLPYSQVINQHKRFPLFLALVGSG
jgi:hypothetical protein